MSEEYTIMHYDREVAKFKKIGNDFKITEVLMRDELPVCCSNGDVSYFIQSRVIPEGRENIDEELAKVNLLIYDAWEIFKLTGGQSMTDYYWVKFNENDLFEDVCFRWKIENNKC